MKSILLACGLLLLGPSLAKAGCQHGAVNVQFAPTAAIVSPLVVTAVPTVAVASPFSVHVQSNSCFLNQSAVQVLSTPVVVQRQVVRQRVRSLAAPTRIRSRVIVR